MTEALVAPVVEAATRGIGERGRGERGERGEVGT